MLTMEMDSGGGTNSYFDIFHSSEDYILNNIDTIYPILLRYFSSSSEDDKVSSRALSIAFGPCLTLFTLDDLEEKLFKYACRYAEKYFIRILKSNSDDNVAGDKYSADICQDIMSQFSSANEYILAELSVLKVEKVKSLLLSISIILLEYYQFCIKYEEENHVQLNQSNEWLLFTKKAQALQCQFFQLLSKVEVSNVGYDMEIINEILTYTYKSGMILLSLDVKTMADVWRGYVTLIDKYSELLKTIHEVSVPIDSLTMNLIQNLENYITSDFCNSQILDKTVKIFCFILKVIIKLVQKFNGFLNRSHKSLINLLIILNQFSDPHYKILNLHADVANQFKPLVIGIDPLLSYLINNEDFAQEFAVELKNLNLNSGKRFGFLLLSCQIITKLTLADANVRSIWCRNGDNILDYIFQAVITCSFELSLDLKFPGILIPGKEKKLTDCFQYLLTHISAFLLMASSKEFVIAEKVLINYVLHPNPWCSLLASDIWCLLARFANAELCYEQLKNLCRLLIQFEKYPPIPEKMFLESTVARLFPIMSQKHRNLFTELYPPEEYAYLWQIFGVQYLSAHLLNTIRSSVCHLAVSHIKRFLSEENFEEKEYEKMESALYGLNNTYKNLDENLEDHLVKLWKIDCNIFVSNPLSKRYLKSLCAATSSTLCFMSAKNMFSVLEDMKLLFSSLEPSCMLYCLDSLDRLGEAAVPQGNLQYNTFLLISFLFKQFMTSQNIFIQTKSTEVFLNFASVTCHTQIITESYNSDRALQTRITNFLQKKPQPTESDWTITKFLKKIEFMKYEHFCDLGSEIALHENDNGEPPYKKLILDKSALENTELENLISALKSAVLKIREKSDCLTGLQKKELTMVNDLLVKMI